MTESEIEQAERSAREDAEWLLLMVLLARGVTFDANSDRFHLNGRSVSVNQIRSYLNRIETRIGKKLNALTADLAAERITADQWAREFRRNVTSAHVLAAALSLGSIAAAVRNAEVQARIDSELAYADNFAEEIAAGSAGTFAQIRARAKSYLLGTAITYGIVSLIVRKVLGVQTECRRVRRASESCPGCIEWARKGWMAIEKMKPLGSLQCRSRCRCYLEYR